MASKFNSTLNFLSGKNSIVWNERFDSLHHEIRDLISRTALFRCNAAHLRNYWPQIKAGTIIYSLSAKAFNFRHKRHHKTPQQAGVEIHIKIRCYLYGSYCRCCEETQRMEHFNFFAPLFIIRCLLYASLGLFYFNSFSLPSHRCYLDDEFLCFLRRSGTKQFVSSRSHANGNGYKNPSSASDAVLCSRWMASEAIQ